MFMSWGISSTFGVFFKPLVTEFDWTRAVTSGAFSISMIIFGILGIIMGGLTDRFGPRLVLSVCGLLLGLGHLLMSQVSIIWQLYLFYGVIIGIGMSGAWVPLVSTTARWFTRRRSVMTGFVVAGMGIGRLFTPPWAQQLISTYGWPIAYTILGSIVLVGIVFVAQFLRRDPAQKNQLPYGHNESQKCALMSEDNSISLKEALHTKQFWLFSGIEFCSGFFIFTIALHIAPHVTEFGFSAATAANILAAIGGANVLGNIIFGSIGDRIGNQWTLSISFALISASLFWLVPSTELWKFWLFAIIFGFADGGLATIPSPLVAELFGLKWHGLIYGVAGLGFTLGASVGPFQAGYIFDVTNSYQLAFLVAAGVGILGIILTILLGPVGERTKRLS